MEVIELARAMGKGDDVHCRELVAEAWVNDRVHDQLTRHVSRAVASGDLGGAATSLPRLSHGVVSERVVDIELEIAGARAGVWSEDDVAGKYGIHYLTRQGRSLGGGSNEMQRNIISERLLGMPREPAADRDKPYRDVRRNTLPAG